VTMVPQCFEGRTYFLEAPYSAVAMSTLLFFFQSIKHNLVLIFLLILFDHSSYYTIQNLFIFPFTIKDCKDCNLINCNFAYSFILV
jgi:hypothetical protein